MIWYFLLLGPPALFLGPVGKIVLAMAGMFIAIPWLYLQPYFYGNYLESYYKSLVPNPIEMISATPFRNICAEYGSSMRLSEASVQQIEREGLAFINQSRMAKPLPPLGMWGPEPARGDTSVQYDRWKPTPIRYDNTPAFPMGCSNMSKADAAIANAVDEAGNAPGNYYIGDGFHYFLLVPKERQLYYWKFD